MKFFIVGMGMGDFSLMTEKTKMTVLDADVIIAGERTAEILKDLKLNIFVCGYREMAEYALKQNCEKVALLVSGDSGFFSMGTVLAKKLAAGGDVELLCGISSLQYFCSKIKKSYDDVFVLSLHGRKNSIVGAVCYNRKVFALTGGENTAAKILNELLERGLGDTEVYIGENLSYENEKITYGKIRELSGAEYSELSVVFFENKYFTDKNTAFYDDDFIRENIPMTKEEVRWISVNKLNILPEHIGYDIGSGTGSVSLEAAKRAYGGEIFAVEKNEAAFNLLRRNIVKNRCFNIKPVFGEAPDVLEKLPAPDFVFVGGSGGNIKKILKTVKEKNPFVRIVVNTIALESTNMAMSMMKELGFQNVAAVTINCARSKAVGCYTMMLANNPVTVISGGGLIE